MLKNQLNSMKSSLKMPAVSFVAGTMLALSGSVMAGSPGVAGDSAPFAVACASGLTVCPSRCVGLGKMVPIVEVGAALCGVTDLSTWEHRKSRTRVKQQRLDLTLRSDL